MIHYECPFLGLLFINHLNHPKFLQMSHKTVSWSSLIKADQDFIRFTINSGTYSIILDNLSPPSNFDPDKPYKSIEFSLENHEMLMGSIVNVNNHRFNLQGIKFLRSFATN